jgi:hypothetical protein
MKEKLSFKDLVDLNIKYVEYLRGKTYVTHQYVRNVKEAGGEVESEVRKLIRSFVPARFKVTHGYIVAASSQAAEPRVSPQVDVLVVDTLVPHSIFVFDDRTGMEVVPVESVVGVLEVKRTLNKRSLLGTKKEKGACEQLHDIVHSVGITKEEPSRYLPGGVPLSGVISGGSFSNPIIGIITIDHEASLCEPEKTDHIDKIRVEAIKAGRFAPVDLIGSLNGMMYALVDSQPPHNFRLVNQRLPDEQYEYRLVTDSQSRSKTYVVSRIFGYILAYVQNSCGRRADVESYFFNLNL